MDSNTPTITLPGKFIVSRNGKHGQKIEQVVTLENIVKGNANQDIYTGWFGQDGFHEVYSGRQNIRELTQQELGDCDAGHYWKLPQQFYQTFQSSPEYNGPIDKSINMLIN